MGIKNRIAVQVHLGAKMGDVIPKTTKAIRAGGMA
jgi:hypothetical protein